MFRRYLPKSLYARVLLIVILPVFAIQSLVTYVFFERHWDLVSSNLSANTASQIALVTALYREAPDEAAREKVEALSEEDLQINVRFQPEETIPADDKTSIFALYNNTLRRHLDDRLEEDFWFNTSSWPAYVEIRVQLDDGYLVFLPRRDRVFATNGPIFVLWLFGVTILLGWIAIVFLRNQVRSILRLATAAEAFGRGRDMPDFRPSGATEVRRAGRAFIAMRERIKRHMQQRTTMLAGVSHDLRTPLTRIKLALAMQPDTAETEALRADVVEMEKMVESYLNFARDLSADDEPERLDAGELAREVAEEAVRAGRRVDLEPSPHVIVRGRRNALKRALGNLVENAHKYAGRAWVSVAAAGDHIELIVDDDGPGIDPARYDEAFRPFTRLDEPGDRGKGGVGLGLSVVRDVARSHGGDVILARSPRGGLRAALKLPA